jgi:hypothetical protein
LPSGAENNRNLLVWVKEKLGIRLRTASRRTNPLGIGQLPRYPITMKKGIWLSFDLGIKGDYENLYKWLDARNARECGDSVAYFTFEYTEDLLTEITTSLLSSVKTNDASRFYLIARLKDGDTRTVGKFIVGKRKAPPWTGYSPRPEEAAPDEA